MKIRRWIALSIALAVAATTVQAGQTGGNVNSTRQYQICAGANVGDSGDPFELTFFDEDGDVVLTKAFAAIAEDAIAKLVYAGLANPVSCEWTGAGSRLDMSLNVVDRRSGKVVGLIGNRESDRYAAVINSRRQYPVCAARCQSAECDIELTWYDAQGNELDTDSFEDVPDNGSVASYYTGFRSPVWCHHEFEQGNGGSAVQLVDRWNGRVDAAHTNVLGSSQSGPGLNDDNQTPVCTGICSSSLGCDLDLTMYGPDGEVVATDSFADVPQFGIRRVAYQGAASPVICDASPGNVSLNLLDGLDGRVQALIGAGGGRLAVVNSPKQYPVCVATCFGAGGCDLEATFYDEDGDAVADASWDDVPDGGTRTLYYQGGEPSVWCDVSSSQGKGSNVVLVHKVTGEVEAAHWMD